jgi:hypothetical protein
MSGPGALRPRAVVAVGGRGGPQGVPARLTQSRCLAEKRRSIFWPCTDASAPVRGSGLGGINRPVCLVTQVDEGSTLNEQGATMTAQAGQPATLEVLGRAGARR